MLVGNSAKLVSELKESDIIIISAPIYNYGPPATLKAWSDLAARVGETFRFKPDGSKMEHMTTTSNNTWGFDFNEAGDVFGSTANNAHGWYMAIPHRNIWNAPFSLNGSKNIDTHKDMKTITNDL